jgi:hypothetical protein
MTDQAKVIPDRKPNETSAAYSKRTGVVPKGLTLSTAPDGETPIFVREPDRATHRVHHPSYGARKVVAKDRTDALRKFFGDFAPAESGDEKWVEEMSKLARVVDLRPAAAMAKAGR